MTEIIHFWLNKEQYRAVVVVHKAHDAVLGIQVEKVFDRHDSEVEVTDRIWDIVWEKVNGRMK